MKYRKLMAGVLFLLCMALLASAGADALIRDLSAQATDATSITANWNCTDKENPLFTVTCGVEGVERRETWSTYRNTFLFSGLCPNTAYVITISSQAGSTQTATVTTPEAFDHIGYNFTLLDAGVYTAPADTEEMAALAAMNGDTLLQMLDETDIGVWFTFTITAAEDDRSLPFLLVAHLPNGDIYTASDLFWYTQRSQTVTQTFVFNDLLTQIAEDYGALPAGEYALSAYFNGGLGAETAFTVE
jgi:hypothetical protein